MLSPVRDFNAIQARIRQTLDKGVQIDLSTESCKRFLRRHVNCKIGVVILYVDVDGSTKMSMALAADKFATVLQVFSQEMSLAISEHGGYTLKYVGDAVIALFPAEYDRRQAAASALDCAKAMREIIARCINPEFLSHELPEIKAKISIDYGDVQALLYGRSIERSHIDIVGSSISTAAKMIQFVQSGQIIVGGPLYENLAETGGFAKLEVDPARWSYTDERSGSAYKLYLLK